MAAQSPPSPSHGWDLFRQADLGHTVELTRLRGLRPDEYERLRDAERMFDAFGPDWPHAVVIRDANAVIEAVAPLRSEFSRHLGLVSVATLDRLRWTFGQFAKHMIDWARRLQATGLPEVADPAAVEVLELLEGRVLPQQFELHAEPGRDRALRLLLKGSELGQDDSIDLEVVVRRGVSVAGVLGGAQLRAAEPELLIAGRSLLDVQAEVLYGKPVLLPSGSPGRGAGETLSLTPQSLGVHKVAPVLAACARARAMASDQEHEVAPADQVPDPHRLLSVATAQGTDPVRPPAGAAPPPAPGEEADEATPLDPVDVQAFLHSVTRITRATEQRWSDALAECLSEDIDLMRAQAASLLAVLYRRIARRQTTNEVEGFSTLLPAIPLEAPVANSLQLDAEGQQRVMQRNLATVHGVHEVLQALDALSEPTSATLDLATGTVSAWWSQRGFTRVIDAAQLALRAEAGDDLEDDARTSIILRLAEAAWAHGMVEASAIYIVDLLDRGAEEAGPLAGAYATLSRAADTLGKGARVSTDVLVPLVRFWLDEVAGRLPDTQPPPETATAEAGQG